MAQQTFRHDPLNFGQMPPATKGLIIANVVVFVVATIVGPKFYELFGLVPQQVIQERWIWQPFTYLFVHGGLMHLLFNLFALWMFGVPVESQWGAAEFLKFYLICGLGAAAASIGLSPHSTIPVIGASGPIYGLLVAFAMLYPDAVVYLYFLIPVKASHMAILFGLIEFFAGTTNATPGVARFAHLGGMVTGYVYIRWWWLIKLRSKAFFSSMFRAPQAAAPPPRPRRAAAQSPAAPEEPEADATERQMAEVDRILDKILVSGLESLTEEERAIMRRYSDRMKH